MKPYDIVDALEKVIAEYGGSKYAVAVDSCTNALLLCLRYHKTCADAFMQRDNYCKDVILPNKTYIGVAYAVLNSGYKCKFEDIQWKGNYNIRHTNIIDSARRFKKGMYESGSLYCLSAHWGKHLKIGRGGFILTDELSIYNALKKMRFDGRTAGVPPTQDTFNTPGNHCYMIPEDAARGLMLMSYMPDDNPDLPWDDYADLNKLEIFK
jgi:dTDP-4-amino-4,6-dideoxygalactose transaminase